MISKQFTILTFFSSICCCITMSSSSIEIFFFYSFFFHSHPILPLTWCKIMDSLKANTVLPLYHVIDRPVHLSVVMPWTDTFPFMREVSDFMHQLMRGSQGLGSLSLFIYSIFHLQSLQSSIRWLYVSAATVTLYSN